jgi:intracellular sulfur oxidation DsrE/DsrF family protein
MKKNYLFKAAFALSVLFGSVSAFAGNGIGGGAGNVAQVFPDVQDPCQYPTLVLNLFSSRFNGAGGYPETQSDECIDVPVALDTIRVVFNLDTDSRDGNGNSIGLKHMVFLATAIKDRIDHYGVNPNKVQIVGVLHGSGAGWAIKSTHPGTAGDSIFQQNAWINKLWALKDDGVNVQLEICGVTMYGHNWTKADLFGYDESGDPVNVDHRILVNQGAIGRIIDLEQHGFVLINEGFEEGVTSHLNPS